jgi:predicted RNA-binding protein with PUA-like domain
MAYWLMKSEPGTYGWDDLVREGATWWDGVRNPAARLHLRAMKPGDQAFFYHSGGERAVVGIMAIAGEAEPDGPDGAWAKVKVEPLRPLGPVTLKAIKADPRLSGMELIRQSRLSVSPVKEEEWAIILKLAG